MFFFHLLYNDYIDSNFSNFILFYLFIFFIHQQPETTAKFALLDLAFIHYLLGPWLFGTNCIYRVLANNVFAQQNFESDKGRHRMPLS